MLVKIWLLWKKITKKFITKKNVTYKNSNDNNYAKWTTHFKSLNSKIIFKIKLN